MNKWDIEDIHQRVADALEHIALGNSHQDVGDHRSGCPACIQAKEMQAFDESQRPTRKEPPNLQAVPKNLHESAVAGLQEPTGSSVL
jgi:hypothetical protein